MSTLAYRTQPAQRRAFGMLVASESRLASRRPAGLIVAVGVPLVLLVIFGSIPATTRARAALGGISFFNLYVPSLLVFVLIAVGLGALPQQLATYRQQGVLRRMSTTPVPPSWLLAAQLTVSMIAGHARDRDPPRRRRRRVRPGAPAQRRRISRVPGDARAHRGGDARPRAVRGRAGQHPPGRERAHRGALLPAGVLLRPLRPHSGDPLDGGPGPRQGAADRAGFNAVHAAFSGHSPG